MKEYLLRLLDALESAGETSAAAMVKGALDGPDAGLEAFLLSNYLWGGAGSIADQAGGPERSAGRRAIETHLIDLGSMQIRAGNANPRTAMWVEAFKAWSRDDT